MNALKAAVDRNTLCGLGVFLTIMAVTMTMAYMSQQSQRAMQPVKYVATYSVFDLMREYEHPKLGVGSPTEELLFDPTPIDHWT